MFANPKPGQAVKIHYAAHYAAIMRFHGKTGQVVQRGRGRPRNHLVKIGETLAVIPCGNLQKI